MIELRKRLQVWFITRDFFELLSFDGELFELLREGETEYFLGIRQNFVFLAMEEYFTRNPFNGPKDIHNHAGDFAFGVTVGCQSYTEVCGKQKSEYIVWSIINWLPISKSRLPVDTANVLGVLKLLSWAIIQT